MRFGMFFELQLPRPWGPGDEATLFAQALEQGALGESCGIDYAWAQEHHFLEEYSHSSAPEVFLAALSQRTHTMRMGHGIVLMPPRYNPPARVAERVSALDLVSGGRVEWGTGESSSRLELEGFGIPYVEKREMWAEALHETARMMVAEPYPGHQGRHFSMPARNVIPKPYQKPHPPVWVACSNRETVRLAARLGLGALTFAFMDAREAKFWVREYYDEFKRGCTPITRRVNPNIAMLSGFLCRKDGEEARRRGIPALQFFAFGLSHYFRTGTHVPARTSVWQEFERQEGSKLAGAGGIGTPDEVTTHMQMLEEAGVDQVIVLQQGGRCGHEEISDSLHLFGSRVASQFRDRHAEREARKLEELAPYIEKAEAQIAPIEEIDVPAVEAFPISWQKDGLADSQLGTRRSLDSSALWRLHVGGLGARRRP